MRSSRIDATSARRLSLARDVTGWMRPPSRSAGQVRVGSLPAGREPTQWTSVQWCAGQIAAGLELLLFPMLSVHWLAVPAVPVPTVSSWQSWTTLSFTSLCRNVLLLSVFPEASATKMPSFWLPEMWLPEMVAPLAPSVTRIPLNRSFTWLFVTVVLTDGGPNAARTLIPDVPPLEPPSIWLSSIDRLMLPPPSRMAVPWFPLGVSTLMSLWAMTAPSLLTATTKVESSTLLLCVTERPTDRF